MIVVNGVIRSSAESIAALKDAVATMEAASRAEEGCHDYTFSVELNDPEVLRVTESWETMEALEAHFKAPHMAEFQAAMANHPPKSVELKFYEATEFTPSRP